MSEILQYPDVYPFARFLAERMDCRYVINVGQFTARNLSLLDEKTQVLGVRCKVRMSGAIQTHYSLDWLDWDFSKPGLLEISKSILSASIIICADVLHRLDEPAYLLENLKRWLDHSPACLLAMPTREPPGRAGRLRRVLRRHHAGRWDAAETEALLRRYGFNLEFVGLTSSDNIRYEKAAVIAVIGTNNPATTVLKVGPGGLPGGRVDKADMSGRSAEGSTHCPAPKDFRVVAFMRVYNEEDILAHSVKYLANQGIDVYVLDNWSTDSSFDLAQKLVGKGILQVERFPADGPTRYHSLKAILQRIEELTGEVDADWFTIRDADEVVRAPWPGLSYRDGIYRVDRSGFNCIDHTVIEFRPIDDSFAPGSDFHSHFKYFEFGRRPGLFLQIKTWKNLGCPVSLAEAAGHQVEFEGRRVFPYKFLLKHYPIRSQAHGEKKVFRERKPRWAPEEFTWGWHVQYNGMEPGYRFRWPPSDLEIFDEDVFNKRYVVERLSGIGIIRPDAGSGRRC